MTYSLYRTRDNAGDSGPMSDIFRHTPEGVERKPGRPTVGYGVIVGSHTARTMSWQDWWATTPVTEILEDTGDMVRFRTGNSEYVWKEF